MNEPRVDVVVVTYNQKKYIRECLESVLAQDYPNIHIFIADDCSTDGAVEILEQYKKKYPDKIDLLLAEKNEGITKNSGRAHPFLEGQFLCLLAGDDLMRHDRVRKQVEALQNSPTSAGCMSNVEVFCSDEDFATGQFGDVQRYISSNPDFTSCSPKRIIATYNQIPSSSLMINRNVFKDYYYDDRTPVVSDWLLVNKVALAGLVYIQEPLLFYRRHSSNTTQRGVDKIYLEDRLIAIDLLFAQTGTYYFSCKRARANVYLQTSSRYFVEKKYQPAVKFLFYSFLESPLNKKLYQLPLKFLIKGLRGWVSGRF